MKKLLLLIILVLVTIFLPVTPKINAQSNEGEVVIVATVTTCILEITIKPEKRIPREGNWSNQQNIIFYDQLYREAFSLENIQTDNNGFASVDICELGIQVDPGIYSIYVKGVSHLGKLFINKGGFFNYTTTFNLAKTEDDYLLAGDYLSQDYINGLDLNGAISKLYSNDSRADFNRDGTVNSLDLSNLIFNLHRSGQLR